VGFKLDYVKADGDISNYYPDFVVKVAGGEIWLVETKGREDLNDPGKWERLQQWCSDASRLDSGQQYRALFVREEEWERYKPKSFRDAATVFGGSEPESGFRVQ
jgi:type III restriction enzyme